MKTRYDEPSALSKCIIALIVIYTLIPLFWLLVISFKTNNEIMLEPLKFPETLNLDNYALAVKRLPFLTMFKNSILLVLMTVPLELVVAFTAAFALAKNRAVSERIREIIRTVFVCGLIIPSSVMIFPIFFFMTKVGLINKLSSVALVSIGWAMPLGVLTLVNAINAIPGSLEEAAIIDGCNIRQLMIKVYLPLIKPSLATLGIVDFLGVWNDFLLCSTLLTGTETRTISMASVYFRAEFMVDYAMMAAASVILIVPQLTVYLFLQKFIISGSVAGAVKG